MKRILVYILGSTLKMYWFVFRPRTYGVKGLLINDGDILLVKTSYSKKFSLPGGGIKKGETAEEAVKREVKEETGIEVLKCHLVGEYENNNEYKNDHISMFYIDEFKVGSKPKTIEIDESGFFPLDDLPKNTSQATLRRVKVKHKEVEHGSW